jgi:hypothetical protein
MGREKQDPCVNCGQAFVPDRRNARHQRYCGSAACKAASKRASQAKWLAKNPTITADRKPWRGSRPGDRSTLDTAAASVRR